VDTSARPDEPLVQIVGPEDNWILERLARRLAAKLPYSEFVPWRPRPARATQLVYYVNYALYNGPSGVIDSAFFTHLDEGHHFLQRARAMHLCVCMCRLYADWLLQRGVKTAVHAPMGFDFYRFRPRLVLGVIGRLDHPRKGRHLVERIKQLPFVEVIATEGHMPEEQLPEVYQRVDYVLIPATVEGGPMCLLEALGAGRPVIAPQDVGMVGDLTPCEYIHCYRTGDAEDLVRVVTACYLQKRRSSQLVQDRTWDRWAEHHHDLFMHLLRDSGLAISQPAPGFRFGLLADLDVPLGQSATHLEEAIDRAAAHLFHGRYSQAQQILAEARRSFPCVQGLIDSLPRS
jgi:hypothetical protein